MSGPVTSAKMTLDSNIHYLVMSSPSVKAASSLNLVSLILIWLFLEAPSAAFHLKHQHYSGGGGGGGGSSSGGIALSSLNLNSQVKIIYANEMTEETLPECGKYSVCNKIDTYDKPWIEKQCKCPSHFQECSSSLLPNDGHTITDKNRQYKLCEPVRKIPKCRYFRDITWTLVTKGDNLTKHIVHCQCPKDSVAYMIKRQVYNMENENLPVNSQSSGLKYSFACSPKSRMLCQRKEPCALFTLVKRKSNVTEVNTSSLCKCPKGYQCPSHHTDGGVIAGKFYPGNLRTYSGYCM